MNRINNPPQFERQFNELFGVIDRTTLSRIENDKKLRIELGCDLDEEQRLKQALERSSKILHDCFENKPVWLRIILWGATEESNIVSAGFSLGSPNKLFRQKDENEILYVYFNRYAKHHLSPIVESIINFDMGEDPSANITCYFINFKSKVIVNLYDDRGLDIYTPNDVLLGEFTERYMEWSV